MIQITINQYRAFVQYIELKKLPYLYRDIPRGTCWLDENHVPVAYSNVTGSFIRVDVLAGWLKEANND